MMLEKVREEIEQELDKIQHQHSWHDSEKEEGLLIALRIINKYIYGGNVNV